MAGDELGFIDGPMVQLDTDHTVAGNPMRFEHGSFELRRGRRVAHVLGSAGPQDHDRPHVAALGCVWLPPGGGSMMRDELRADPLPTVSVVVPTRQRPELLRRALVSILGQAYEGDIEVLVVFDQEEPLDPEIEVAVGRSIKLLRERAANRLGRRAEHRHRGGNRRLRGPLRRRRRMVAGQAPAPGPSALAAIPSAEVVVTGVSIVYDDRVIDRVPTTDVVVLDSSSVADPGGSPIVDPRPARDVSRRGRPHRRGDPRELRGGLRMAAAGQSEGTHPRRAGSRSYGPIGIARRSSPIGGRRSSRRSSTSWPSIRSSRDNPVVSLASTVDWRSRMPRWVIDRSPDIGVGHRSGSTPGSGAPILPSA